jgi:hypothetical protein
MLGGHSKIILRIFYDLSQHLGGCIIVREISMFRVIILLLIMNMMHCLINTPYAESLFCTLVVTDPAIQTTTSHKFWRANILVRKHFGAQTFCRANILARKNFGDFFTRPRGSSATYLLFTLATSPLLIHCTYLFLSSIVLLLFLYSSVTNLT